jgi:uncharacterized tellurite resistance protein B-like protein
MQRVKDYLTGMFDALLRRLTTPNSGRLPAADAQLSLATLLVRVARADGLYAQAEVDRIDRVLGLQFGLDPFAAARLRRDAEGMEAVAPDTVRFTRALKDAVAPEDRAGMMQALWSVALADGVRDDIEDQVLRLVSNLLGLSDQESAMARRRAEARP